MVLLAKQGLGGFNSGMTLLAVGVSWALTVLAVSVAVSAHRRSQDVPSSRTPPPDTSALRDSVATLGREIAELRAAYAEIDGWRDDLTIAVDEGVKKVERSENRIRATVRRAREELEEHGLRSPGLEAEARQLHEIDGEGSERGGMQPVPASVEGGFAAPRGFPGTWTSENTRLMRGNSA